jgi:hypothetical protein
MIGRHTAGKVTNTRGIALMAAVLALLIAGALVLTQFLAQSRTTVEPIDVVPRASPSRRTPDPTPPPVPDSADDAPQGADPGPVLRPAPAGGDDGSDPRARESGDDDD